jgi:hypothetical protein
MLASIQPCRAHLVSFIKPKSFHILANLSFPSTLPRTMRVITIPALDNSLMYLVGDEESEVAALIDASDANKAVKAAEKAGLKVS